MEFTSAYDIHSGVEIGEVAENGYVGATFHCIADERVCGCEGIGEALVVIAEGLCAVEVGWGVELFCDCFNGNVFAVEVAVFVVEVVHGVECMWLGELLRDVLDAIPNVIRGERK